MFFSRDYIISPFNSLFCFSVALPCSLDSMRIAYKRNSSVGQYEIIYSVEAVIHTDLWPAARTDSTVFRSERSLALSLWWYGNVWFFFKSLEQTHYYEENCSILYLLSKCVSFERFKYRKIMFFSCKYICTKQAWGECWESIFHSRLLLLLPLSHISLSLCFRQSHFVIIFLDPFDSTVIRCTTNNLHLLLEQKDGKF